MRAQSSQAIQDASAAHRGDVTRETTLGRQGYLFAFLGSLFATGNKYPGALELLGPVAGPVSRLKVAHVLSLLLLGVTAAPAAADPPVLVTVGDSTIGLEPVLSDLTVQHDGALLTWTNPAAAAFDSFAVYRIVVLTSDGLNPSPVPVLVGEVDVLEGQRTYTLLDGDYMIHTLTFYYVRGLIDGVDTSLSNLISNYPRCSWGWVSTSPPTLGFNFSCLLPAPGTTYPCAPLELTILPLYYNPRPECLT